MFYFTNGETLGNFSINDVPYFKKSVPINWEPDIHSITIGYLSEFRIDYSSVKDENGYIILWENETYYKKLIKGIKIN